MDKGTRAILCVVAAAALAVSCDQAPDSRGNCDYQSLKAEDFSHSVVQVDPTATNAGITSISGRKHYIYIPHHKSNSRQPLPSPPAEGERYLSLILGGTGSSPTGLTNLAKTSAITGMITIALVYDNIESPHIPCGTDDDCYVSYRSEKAFGEDLSPHLSIDFANSIQGRLLYLFQFLEGADANGNWGQYYEGTEINWDKVVVSGHSQGGGFAAFIAYRHKVAKAIYLSNPGDGLFTGVDIDEPASWTLLDRATPASRQYGFHHSLEEAVTKNKKIYKVQGMDDFGSLRDVDSSSLNCGHIFETSALRSGGSAGDGHPSMASDNFMPLDDAGFPVNFDTYVYLYSRDL